MSTYRDNLHLGRKVPLVEGDDIACHAIKGCHIAPGAVTIDKIGEGILPSDMALVNFILPWFDIEPGEDGDDWLVAWYADDGAIKDIYAVEDGEYIELWMVITDGDSSKEREQGWDDVDYLQDRRVMVNSDLSNEICPVDLIEGGECTVVYENTTTDTDFHITISSKYRTPDGNTVEMTCPRGGYCEASWIMTGGVVYVRGV